MRRTLRYALLLTALFTGAAVADPGSAQGGGQSNGNGAAASGPTGNSGNRPVQVPKDERVAREAVKKHQAISLEALTALVARVSTGRMLDVELVRLDGATVYEVTVLEADGRLRKLYYDPRSGALKGER